MSPPHPDLMKGMACLSSLKCPNPDLLKGMACLLCLKGPNPDLRLRKINGELRLGETLA
jgi:hypothetical protein